MRVVRARAGTKEQPTTTPTPIIAALRSMGMSESLLDRSSRFIDEGVEEGRTSTNPVGCSFHELGDRVRAAMRRKARVYLVVHISYLPSYSLGSNDD